jgi:PTH1 family peptidyl-tRNA hydrolase
VKLIVGLGNPGPQYRDTRHNIGFAVVDLLARRSGLTFGGGPTGALIARVRQPGEGALLAKPLTYMNLSGAAVADLSRYFRVAIPDVIIVADDVNLPLGKLRARARGSDGGHHGLRSIIERLGTSEFARLRIGVGRGDPRRDLADHVLARFDADEQGEVDSAIGRAADAVEMFVTDGIEKVMNQINPEPVAGDPEIP